MNGGARLQNWWLRAAGLGCAVVLHAGCRGQATAERSAAIQVSVERWLTCEECLAGERDSVRAFGRVAVPPLREALHGPPDSVIAGMTRSSVDAYARVRRSFERLSPADQALRPLADSTAFLTRNVENFRATYRTRAAIALHDIDAPGARALFNEELRVDSLGVRPLTPELRRLLDSLSGVP